MPLNDDIQALVKQSEEIFPVGSQLFPAHARKPLHHFYAFARYADNIADSPDLPPEQKRQFLSLMQEMLRTQQDEHWPNWLQPYMDDVKAGTTNPEYGITLLSAFLQDVDQDRYPDFASLLEYCSKSAAPVGRVVLELCEEGDADLEAADNLCNALQLLNHLRDCKKDYQTLNRIYIPQEWLQAFGVPERDLGLEETSLPLRRLFNEYIYQCRMMLDKGDNLVDTLKSKQLRREISLTLELAWAMAKQLSKQDPLEDKVKVPKWQWAIYLLKGMKRT